MVSQITLQIFDNDIFTNIQIFGNCVKVYVTWPVFAQDHTISSTTVINQNNSSHNTKYILKSA